MRYNQATATYQIFKAFWDTEKIDGPNGKVEVFVDRMIFYNNGFLKSTQLKKFAKSIGIVWEDFISQDIDSEVELMYFYLKDGYVWSGERAWVDFGSYQKTPTNPKRAPTAQEVADSINAAYDIGEQVKVTISYGGALGRYISEHDLTWIATGVDIITGPLNTDVIRSVIHSTPWYFMVNSRHMPYVKNSSPYQEYHGGNDTLETVYRPTDRKLSVCEVYSEKSRYGIFALLNREESFELELDANGNAVLYDENIGTNGAGVNTAQYELVEQSDGSFLLEDIGGVNSYGGRGEVVDYRYTLQYTFKGVTASSALVQEILGWYDFYYEDLDDIKYEPRENDKYKEELTTTMIDTKFKHLFIDMMVDTQVANETDIFEDSLYLKVPKLNWEGYYEGHTSHLKVTSIESMKKSDFVKFLSKQIDTDYTVEKKKWWEALLAIVLIVASIAIAFFTAGASAGWTLAVIAQFAGTLAIALSISGMILSEVGGLSAGGLVKIIGKFAQISGYIAMVAGIAAAYQGFVANVAQAGREAGTEALKDQALKTAMEKVTVSDMINFAVDSAIDSVSNMFTDAAQMSVGEIASAANDGIKMLKAVNDYLVDKEFKEVQDDLNAELEKSEEWNNSLSSNVFKNGSVTMGMEMGRISEYDAISNIDLEKYNASAVAFKTEESYNWYIGVNS